MVLNWKAVFGTLGVLVLFLSGALVLPLIVSLIYKESDWWGYGLTILVAVVLGGGLRLIGRGSRKQLEIREGFAVVALSWFVLSLIGALPFVLSGVLSSYSNAFFETMSGFTTTGATILGGNRYPSNRGIAQLIAFLEKPDTLAGRDGNHRVDTGYYAHTRHRRGSIIQS